MIETQDRLIELQNVTNSDFSKFIPCLIPTIVIGLIQFK